MQWSIPLVALSQQYSKDHSFTRIDSFAKTVKFKKNVYQLTKELTDPYPEQLETYGMTTNSINPVKK